MKMKGHITEADRINEKEAEEIIAEITLQINGSANKANKEQIKGSASK